MVLIRTVFETENELPKHFAGARLCDRIFLVLALHDAAALGMLHD